MTSRLRIARRDPALRAVVSDRHSLLYAQGADPGLDRPAHVRAASSVVRVGERLLVVQDDASFLAVVEPGAPQRSIAHPLVAGPGGARQFDDARGNKAFKLDLEAAVVLDDGTVLVFGSGSSPRRESIVVARDLDSERPDVRVVHAEALYASLRACTELSGSELNLEGAIAVGDRIRLFQRGNGAPRGELLPVDATCELSASGLVAYLEGRAPPPPIEDVVRWDLGSVSGVRLGFTDAARVGDRTFWLAAAEASPDATRDGPVAGVAIGVLGPDGDARFADVLHEGAPFDGKAEGIVFGPTEVGGARDRGFVVVDRDDPDSPAELWIFELLGPW